MYDNSYEKIIEELAVKMYINNEELDARELNDITKKFDIEITDLFKDITDKYKKIKIERERVYEKFPTEKLMNNFNLTMNLCILFDTDMERLLYNFKDYECEYYKNGELIKPYFPEVSNFIEQFMYNNGWELRDYNNTVEDFCQLHPHGSYLVEVKKADNYIVIKDGKIYSYYPYKEIVNEKINHFFYNENLNTAILLFNSYIDVPKDEEGKLLESWDEFQVGTSSERVFRWFKHKFYVEIKNGFIEWNYNLFKIG